MSHTLRYLILTLVSCVLWSCQPDEHEQRSFEIPNAIPMNKINLQDLSAFDSLGTNWRLAGGVVSDYEQEHALVSEPGTGVLVNMPSEEARSNLFMVFEHGDIELEIEFMMPKNSNSGLYFQGRYEIQLFDSWNVADPSYSDCGGIYQRWDENMPEGQKGYDGVAPRVNASLAPGLWQTVRALFRAPRFDVEGKKTKNAMFEQVYLNGKLIHENVELTGPTRGSADNPESPLGKFMIQGDHGPVAFRNIRYKTFDHTKKLVLKDLTYNYYEGKWDTLPDFSSIIPVDSGSSNWLEVSKLAKQNEDYGFVFKGNLVVPVTGRYLFDVWFDNGGELFIDGKRILGDVGKNGGGNDRNFVDLTTGEHDFEVSHFQTIWSSSIKISYEGPTIIKQTLGLEAGNIQRNPPDPIIVEALSAPEMIRGFIQYKDTVKTHALSVGDPSAVHYTYDLSTGAPILAWKGDYADAAGMWRSRGQTQLLEHGNAAVELDDGPILGSLVNKKWTAKDNYVFRRYILNEKERPVFHSTYGNIAVTDNIIPINGGVPGLQRTIIIENGIRGDAILIASGSNIEITKNGWINVNGHYYLIPSSPMEKEMQIIENVGIVVPISFDKVNIQYTIIW